MLRDALFLWIMFGSLVYLLVQSQRKMFPASLRKEIAFAIAGGPCVVAFWVVAIPIGKLVRYMDK